VLTQPATSVGQRVLRATPTTGSQYDIGLADSEPERNTYSIGIVGLAISASPTDVVVIQGSATRLVRVKSMIISSAASSANSSAPISIIRRSSANTGGTSTTPALNTHDTTDPAPTAVVRLYTAPPSALGTQVGTTPLHFVRIATQINPNNLDRGAFQFAWQNDKAIVLNGASDFLCINLGGSTLGGNPVSLDFDILLTEE